MITIAMITIAIISYRGVIVNQGGFKGGSDPLWILHCEAEQYPSEAVQFYHFISEAVRSSEAVQV